MTQDSAVEISGLVKNFGRVRALDGLDLSVPVGTVAGFLGPNGSGKSTTLRILLGLMRADAGDARLLGGDAWADAVDLHRRVAYVPGDVTLWPNLTGGQAIDIITDLRGQREPARIRSFAERFDLDLTKKARSYSKGNRQKVALVAALASRAELLVLDEPTSGLDPLMEQLFTECIREVRDEGRSVLLSSHIFAEVEKLCDTVTIIRDGRTVEAAPLASLRHLQRPTVRVAVGAPGAATTLAATPGVSELRTDDGHVVFSVEGEQLGAVLGVLGSLDPSGLSVEATSLEELFLRHYGTATR